MTGQPANLFRVPWSLAAGAGGWPVPSRPGARGGHRGTSARRVTRSCSRPGWGFASGRPPDLVRERRQRVREAFREPFLEPCDDRTDPVALGAPPGRGSGARHRVPARGIDQYQRRRHAQVRSAVGGVTVDRVEASHTHARRPPGAARGGGERAPDEGGRIHQVQQSAVHPMPSPTSWSPAVQQRTPSQCSPPASRSLSARTSSKIDGVEAGELDAARVGLRRPRDLLQEPGAAGIDPRACPHGQRSSARSRPCWRASTYDRSAAGMFRP